MDTVTIYLINRAFGLRVFCNLSVGILIIGIYQNIITKDSLIMDNHLNVIAYNSYDQKLPHDNTQAVYLNGKNLNADILPLSENRICLINSF